MAAWMARNARAAGERRSAVIGPRRRHHRAPPQRSAPQRSAPATFQHMSENGNSTPLGRLSQLGQSVWVDFISREALESGELERMVREDAVVGLTSNPTIFQKAIASGHHYDDQLREVLEHEEDGGEVFLQLAVTDIQDAADLLRPIWDEGSGRDGYVSLEVDPTLAHDADGTSQAAQRIWDLVDRPNLLVKIPGTKEGLQAIEDSIANGISVNVTLLFSLERHAEVCDAYIKGLERLVEGGGDPTGIASVASFFVSRVDSEVDNRLDEAGGHDELKGKVAIANAKLAYQTYKEKFSGDRWQALADKGATPQRALWASTSTKNPDYRDVMYVEELIGQDTVNTMPLETIEAFQDHGEVANTIEEDLDDAQKVFDDLEAAGIDMKDVGQTLEREGVEKFAKSFEELLQDVKQKRDALAAA
jgi:transaldolase